MESSSKQKYFLKEQDFKQHLFQDKLDEEIFLIDLYFYQAQNNLVYRNYLRRLSFPIDKVESVEDIPFMPISFFKKRYFWKDKTDAVFEILTISD